VEPAFQKLDQVLAGVALGRRALLVDAAELSLAEIGVIPLSLLGHSSGFRNDGVWLDRKGSLLTEQGKITERFHRINYGTWKCG